MPSPTWRLDIWQPHGKVVVWRSISSTAWCATRRVSRCWTYWQRNWTWVRCGGHFVGSDRDWMDPLRQPKLGNHGPFLSEKIINLPIAIAVVMNTHLGMVCTTYLWWSGGWFILVLPTLKDFPMFHHLPRVPPRHPAWCPTVGPCHVPSCCPRCCPRSWTWPSAVAGAANRRRGGWRSCWATSSRPWGPGGWSLPRDPLIETWRVFGDFSCFVPFFAAKNLVMFGEIWGFWCHFLWKSILGMLKRNAGDFCIYFFSPFPGWTHYHA